MERWLSAAGRGRGEVIWLGLGVPGGLVFVGAEVAEFLLDAAGVVRGVDVFEDRVLGLVAGSSAGSVDEFDLQRRPEVLHQRVSYKSPTEPIDGRIPLSCKRCEKRKLV